MPPREVEAIRVRERERREIFDLRPNELRYLQRLEKEKAISLSPGSKPDSVVLTAKMHCGVVQAGRKRIYIEPKVPTRNLLYLVESTYAMPEIRFFDEAKYATGESFSEFLLHFFYLKVDALLRSGLYRSYASHVENTTSIRGRILIAQTLTRNYADRHRVYCETDEYTVDILENQIIRFTLDATQGLASGSPLRYPLRKLRAGFADVTRPRHLPLDTFSRVVYHRLNEHYRPVHELCLLFLRHLSLDIPIGRVSFYSFLVNMEVLFQEFLFSIIRRSPAFAGMRVERQSESRILLKRGTGITGDISVRPDVRLRNGGGFLIIDAKYKEPLVAHFHRRIPVTPDVYQIVTYCLTNSSPGALVYPKTRQFEEDLAETYEITGSGATFTLRTIDLSTELSALPRVCWQLCRDLYAFAEEEKVAVTR
jgi:5-methylcytosine-specific restriction endonuclease McrBC regulatory subunit McrC